MVDKINIQLSKQRHGKIFSYFETHDGTPLQILQDLINENECQKIIINERKDVVEEFGKLFMPELLQIRLATRASEKYSWTLAQIKNTELYERQMLQPDNPFPKVKTTSEWKSETFALADTKWDDMMKNIKEQRADRANREMAKKGLNE
ncbi:hypothetical protein LKF67_2481 [Lactococcus lactis subsp. lactis]|uniref:hypothetical protein n=1 Tax=Lactococcus lactis TaxID=1358 RepID=UPI00071E26D2|nr:hypothetical protein [Lactococcus lactis]KST87967.1 hypothetical protein LKF67_2481 [Lactococcus lactis subsp. lactis]